MVGGMFATQNKLEVYQTLPLYAKGQQRQTNSHHHQVVHEFTAVCDDLAKRKNHRPPTEQHITYRVICTSGWQLAFLQLRT